MPLRTFLLGKLHRATLTGCEVEYEGSISIDSELLKAAGIAPYEQVDVYNVDNGERLTTYAIEGGPGEVCLNGAAALKGECGQRVIIACYGLLEPAEAAAHSPKVVLLDEQNRPKMK